MRLLLVSCAVVAALSAEPEGSFSHATHAPLNLPCTYCHAGAETNLAAGFPTLETCRACHTEIAERDIPERRVYRIPDFIFFSHGRHSKAGAACADCHGAVAEQARIEIVRPPTMLECIACHKERQASIDCNLCHELGQ